VCIQTAPRQVAERKQDVRAVAPNLKQESARRRRRRRRRRRPRCRKSCTGSISVGPSRLPASPPPRTHPPLDTLTDEADPDALWPLLSPSQRSASSPRCATPPAPLAQATPRQPHLATPAAPMVGVAPSTSTDTDPPDGHTCAPPPRMMPLPPPSRRGSRHPAAPLPPLQHPRTLVRPPPRTLAPRPLPRPTNPRPPHKPGLRYVTRRLATSPLAALSRATRPHHRTSLPRTHGTLPRRPPLHARPPQQSGAGWGGAGAGAGLGRRAMRGGRRRCAASRSQAGECRGRAASASCRAGEVLSGRVRSGTGAEDSPRRGGTERRGRRWSALGGRAVERRAARKGARVCEEGLCGGVVGVARESAAKGRGGEPACDVGVGQAVWGGRGLVGRGRGGGVRGCGGGRTRVRGCCRGGSGAAGWRLPRRGGRGEGHHAGRGGACVSVWGVGVGAGAGGRLPPWGAAGGGEGAGWRGVAARAGLAGWRIAVRKAERWEGESSGQRASGSASSVRGVKGGRCVREAGRRGAGRDRRD